MEWKYLFRKGDKPIIIIHSCARSLCRLQSGSTFCRASLEPGLTNEIAPNQLGAGTRKSWSRHKNRTQRSQIVYMIADNSLLIILPASERNDREPRADNPFSRQENARQRGAARAGAAGAKRPARRREYLTVGQTRGSAKLFYGFGKTARNLVVTRIWSVQRTGSWSGLLVGTSSCWPNHRCCTFVYLIDCIFSSKLFSLDWTCK